MSVPLVGKEEESAPEDGATARDIISPTLGKAWSLLTWPTSCCSTLCQPFLCNNQIGLGRSVWIWNC